MHVKTVLQVKGRKSPSRQMARVTFFRRNNFVQDVKKPERREVIFKRVKHASTGKSTKLLSTGLCEKQAATYR